jgi:DNA polymerase-3 subunit alpha
MSSLDGLATVSKMAHKARKMGFRALALTDHGNIGGWIKFIRECTSTKDKDGKPLPYSPIKPLLGCEFYLCRNMEWKNKELQTDGKKGNRHLILTAKNWKGYQNLCALSQASWLDGFYSNPRIDIDLLAKHSEGVICQSACLNSLINANLLHDRYDKARQICTKFKDIFGKDFYLEMMYHGIEAQKAIIPDILKLSAELGIPTAASNDCHYLEKEDHTAHDVLLCMQTSKCIKDQNRMHFPYGEFYMKSAEEMSRMFSGIPQSLSNTVALAESVDFDEISKNLFGGFKLPKFDVPEEYNKGNDFDNAYAFLSKLAWDGMIKRGWGKSQKHIERLKTELDDIKVAWDNNGYDFATYFLIKWDILNMSREKGILHAPGRGSAYGSLLAHCIGIAYGLDPLEYGLLWERFLGFADAKVVLEGDFGFTSGIDLEIEEELEEEDFEL